jgi:hypothetical protein
VGVVAVRGSVDDVAKDGRHCSWPWRAARGRRGQRQGQGRGDDVDEAGA